jgi:RNA polymerase sigma factor (sigma-70 family)
MKTHANAIPEPVRISFRRRIAMPWASAAPFSRNMATDPQEALPSGTSKVSEDAKARLDQLARHYYAPLRSFFRKRTRNSSEVHDLVQQVFLRLAKHGTLNIENADGYIFHTAANTLKDHYRRESVRERFAQDPAHYPRDSEFSPERVLEGKEALDGVAAVLRGLAERTRDVFVLRCFEGLKYAEIASLHGISVRAVEKHMAKALARLNEILSDTEAGGPESRGRGS